MFAFELKAPVKLRLSLETGEVLGRAEFTDSDRMYQVVYVDGNGYHKREWIMENELVPASMIQG